jgi:outer membrane protein assembly factor BamB
MLMVVGACTMVRTAGMIGGGGIEFHWRWTPTPEERLLATANDDPTPAAATPATPSVSPAATSSAAPAVTTSAPVSTRPADWPGFRGPHRDAVIHNVRIATDWTTSPPVQLWRRPIGPGWSSFAVDRGLIYTQEQRGEDEIVSCYRLSNGEPVWRHRDHVRFWESNGGAGPRGTPTLAGGRVYALGATGILNVLDAGNGAVIWTRNAAEDTKTKTPMWGFSSSPLVMGDLVIVATSGKLAAYDLATGTPKWYGPVHRGSYSSPQLVTLDGVDQVVLMSADGATSVSPDTGKLFWEHTWGGEGTPIIQPAVTADGDLLINAISAMGGLGIRRIAVSHRADAWSVAERWTSTGLKPYFNDFVIHKGHAYGFDGSILSCIDLTDGTRKWKGGRYGSGQLILLPDDDVLLVIAEEGDLALVSATPNEFKELAKVPAIDGKTWNHPVLVGDTLLVRNGEVMAAFRLTLAGR